MVLVVLAFARFFVHEKDVQKHVKQLPRRTPQGKLKCREAKTNDNAPRSELRVFDLKK